MTTIDDLRARVEIEGLTAATRDALHHAVSDGDISINQARELLRLAPFNIPEPLASALIPLPEVRRLDLKRGDRLAVILPPHIHSAQQVHEFSQRLQAQLDAYVPEVRAIVFEHGTELDIVRPGPRYPVGVENPAEWRTDPDGRRRAYTRDGRLPDLPMGKP